MTHSPDEYAAELAARDAATQFNPFRDESEDVSGAGIVYADESEWADEYRGED